MSLPRPPSSAEQRHIESSSSLAIETENISRSPAGAEEEVIPRPQSLPDPSENSNEAARIDVDSFSSSSPTIAGTGSTILDFEASPHPSDTPFNSPHHPDRPYLPLASAVDSATDIREPLYLETPLILPNAEFSHQELFGTSVRDFMEADSLAGDEIVATKMATIPLSDDSTVANKSNKVLSIKQTALDLPPSYSKLPRLRTGAPAYELTNREIRPINQASQESSSSAAMIIAPEIPMFARWSGGSDFSFDGMSINMKSRDISADNLGQNTSYDEEISPTTNAPPGTISDSALTGWCRRHETPDNELSDPGASITGRSSNFSSDRDNNTFVNSQSTIDNIPKSTSGRTNEGAESPVYPVLSSHTTTPGVPRDITGELPSPELQTPSQSYSRLGKRKRMLSGVQKFYRKVRTLLLRRRVLDFIVGRQLAEPTRDGLRAISKGLPANIVKVTVSEPDSPRSILS